MQSPAPVPNYRAEVPFHRRLRQSDGGRNRQRQLEKRIQIGVQCKTESDIEPLPGASLAFRKNPTSCLRSPRRRSALLVLVEARLEGSLIESFKWERQTGLPFFL